MAIPSVLLVIAILLAAAADTTFDCGRSSERSELPRRAIAVLGRVTAVITSTSSIVTVSGRAFRNDGGDIMMRKITIALAALAFAGVIAAATTADARMGGGGGIA